MEVVIYVAKEEEVSGAEAVLKAVKDLPQEAGRVVSLSGAQRGGIPAEVMQVMVLKKTGTFPLTVIDSNPVVSGRLPNAEELRQFLFEGVKAPAILVNRADSAVQFPTAQRIHVSMDVSDIKAATAFYKVLFGQEPTKTRDDYAKFEVEEPPLNIALNQFSHHGAKKGGPVNHFGIQVKSSDAVLEAKERYVKAGFVVEEEMATACCYAVQNKIWVADPDGNRWEVFVVTEANAEEGCGPDCICYQELQPSFAKAEVGV